ncbi:MAG TPA: dihydroxyacetone kinase [Lachnospiraceae bacterium]|nr:dihydroxyacetone kinase [Lachnospiraceae bacterium]
MFLAGAKALEARKAEINELNVFPVPDGDTGTNMTLTIMSAAKEVAVLDELKMDTLSKAMSSGSLRGARGNSGVILSQLIRGFTKVIKTEEVLDKAILSTAMQKAAESAYKAVMKPKEGTILTVARGAAEKAAELSGTDMDLASFMEEIIKHSEYILSQTPEMLPVLKQAGVVDSGGQGLLELLKGARDCFIGKELDLTLQDDTEKEDVREEEIRYSYRVSFTDRITEVFNQKNEDDFKVYLNSIGDGLRYEAKGDTVSVELCTNDPGLALQKGIMYGALDDIRIENIKLSVEREKAQASREEVQAKDQKPEGSPKAPDKAGDDAKKHENAGERKESVDITHPSREVKTEAESVKETEKEKPEEDRPVFTEPPKEMGFIAVSSGEGLEAIFKGLGVDYVITGGQTMNPSTEDMLYAIDRVNAKNIFILPNNKNIIMAANQARYMAEDKNIIVIPTKTIPQGITALINYSMDAGVGENEKLMTEEIKKVKTGQVTYAVRDTVISDMEIKQGNIMGIGDHDILAVGTIVEDTAIAMLEKMVDEDSELISIYYGNEVDEEAAEELRQTVTDKYRDCEVELHFGGQPIYYYIVSVE